MDTLSKRRKWIIPALPFEDTQALFALLVFSPQRLRVLVLVILVVLKGWNAEISRARAVKGLLSAFVMALACQQLVPVLYEPFQIMSLAAVAATLAGSPGLVANSLYAATLLSTWRVWIYAYRSVALMEDSPPVFSVPSAGMPIVLLATQNPLEALKSVFQSSTSSGTGSSGLDGLGRSDLSLYDLNFDSYNYAKILVAQTLAITALALILAQEMSLLPTCDPVDFLVNNLPDRWTAKGNTREPEAQEELPPLEIPKSNTTRRRLGAIWKRQPLWMFIALLRSRPRATEDDLTSSETEDVTICYVEDDCVGLKVSDIDRKLFVIDGVEWLQVFIDNANSLAIIGGLAKATSYQVEIFDTKLGTSTKHNISTLLPDSREHARKLSASATLEEASLKAKELLNGERQKLRKVRKEHAKQLSALKQELKSQGARYERNAKAEARSGSRISSLQDNEKQLRASVSALQSSLYELKKQLKEREPAHLERKQEHEAARAEHLSQTKHASESLQSERAMLDRLKAELMRMETKNTRLSNRCQKLAKETDENASLAKVRLQTLLSERQVSREARERRRVRLRHDFEFSTAQLNEGAMDAQRRVQPWIAMHPAPGI